MKRQLGAAVLAWVVGLGFFSTAVQARDLTIASFNIKWYGTGGYMDGSPEDETRDGTLRTFVNRELRDADVIVFQEIVDVDRFVSRVIDEQDRWCIDYDHDWYPHQNVVICGKRDYRFDIDPYDDNYRLESVAYNDTKSRPALHGVLKTKDGEPIARIIGVHLKAYPDQSSTRVRQTGAIAEHIANVGYEMPVIVVGDMNTYFSPDNGEDADDVDLFMDVYRDYNVRMRWVPNSSFYTYRSGRYTNLLDHIFTTTGLWQDGDLYVLGPCNSSNRREVERYNEEISDHCPIMTTFRLR